MTQRPGGKCKQLMFLIISISAAFHCETDQDQEAEQKRWLDLACDIMALKMSSILNLVLKIRKYTKYSRQLNCTSRAFSIID